MIENYLGIMMRILSPYNYDDAGNYDENSITQYNYDDAEKLRFIGILAYSKSAETKFLMIVWKASLECGRLN